jgi:EAL domain-containing protein (putative c-di-GMP-specific phosphodiesterase class I)
MVLHYQPLLDMSNGNLVGVEALIRWLHPEFGILLPERFIPLAEEMGIISGIGDWVLQEACQQMAVWHKAGFIVPRVSVNISVRQLERAGFSKFVGQQLREYDLSPATLALEITESVLMEHVERSRESLARLQALGVSLAIDDFGTGYSSLSHLKNLPIHQLKVDQAFINEIGKSKNGETIARAIIMLAKSLSLELVAEGVEAHEQENFLRTEGCKLAQGFFYAKPMSADRLTMEWQDKPIGVISSLSD